MELEAKKHYFGFDWLRAFFCLDVVAMHVGVFGHLTGSLPDYFVRSYIAIIAVPVFYGVSLFLYVDRGTTWKRRVKELGFIYVFWLIVIVATKTGGNFADTFSTPKNILSFLVGGHTQMFFLLDLILLCTIISLARKAPAYLNVVFLAVTLTLMVFAYPLSLLLGIPITRLNPLNWLAYPFVMMLTWRIKDNGKLALTLLGTCTLICVALESMLFTTVPPSLLMREDYAFYFGGYCRPSLVFVAALAVFAATYVRYHPYLIMKLSQLSLGIFLLHDIAIQYITAFSPAASPILLWAEVVAVSALVAQVLKQRKIRII